MLYTWDDGLEPCKPLWRPGSNASLSVKLLLPRQWDVARNHSIDIPGLSGLWRFIMSYRV